MKLPGALQRRLRGVKKHGRKLCTREYFSLAIMQLLHHKEVTEKLPLQKKSRHPISTCGNMKHAKVPYQSERPGHVRSSFAMHLIKTICVGYLVSYQFTM